MNIWNSNVGDLMTFFKAIPLKIMFNLQIGLAVQYHCMMVGTGTALFDSPMWRDDLLTITPINDRVSETMSLVIVLKTRVPWNS